MSGEEHSCLATLRLAAPAWLEACSRACLRCSLPACSCPHRYPWGGNLGPERSPCFTLPMARRDGPTTTVPVRHVRSDQYQLIVLFKTEAELQQDAFPYLNDVEVDTDAAAAAGADAGAGGGGGGGRAGSNTTGPTPMRHCGPTDDEARERWRRYRIITGLPELPEGENLDVIPKDIPLRVEEVPIGEEFLQVAGKAIVYVGEGEVRAGAGAPCPAARPAPAAAALRSNPGSARDCVRHTARLPSPSSAPYHQPLARSLPRSLPRLSPALPPQDDNSDRVFIRKALQEIQYCEGRFHTLKYAIAELVLMEPVLREGVDVYDTAGGGDMAEFNRMCTVRVLQESDHVRCCHRRRRASYPATLDGSAFVERSCSPDALDPPSVCVLAGGGPCGPFD